MHNCRRLNSKQACSLLDWIRTRCLMFTQYNNHNNKIFNKINSSNDNNNPNNNVSNQYNHSRCHQCKRYNQSTIWLLRCCKLIGRTWTYKDQSRMKSKRKFNRHSGSKLSRSNSRLQWWYLNHQCNSKYLTRRRCDNRSQNPLQFWIGWVWISRSFKSMMWTFWHLRTYLKNSKWIYCRVLVLPRSNSGNNNKPSIQPSWVNCLQNYNSNWCSLSPNHNNRGWIR